MSTTALVTPRSITRTTSAAPRFQMKYVTTHRVLLALLFLVCTFTYYLGTLAGWVRWDVTAWQSFNAAHDFHCLLFLVPIILAAYIYGIKGTIAVTAASIAVLVPRTLINQPHPDSAIWAGVGCVVNGAVGYLFALERKSRLRAEDVAFSMTAATERPDSEPTSAAAAITPVAVSAAPAELPEPGVISIGDLQFNPNKRHVRRHGDIIKLTPTEFELLYYLLRNCGRVLTHVELLRAVWGPEYGQEYEYLRTFISQLRRKIEDDPSNPRFIVTEPGVGYRFAEPAEVQTAPVLSQV